MDEMLKMLMAEMIKKHPAAIKYEPWLQYPDKKEMEAARTREFVRKGIIWFCAEKIPVVGDLSDKYPSLEAAVSRIYTAAEDDQDFDKALDTVAAKFLELFPCQ